MRLIRFVIPVALVALVGAGCSAHSIREGEWKMMFYAQDARTRESVDEYLEANLTRQHRVRVSVGWSRKTGGEVVEVTPISSHSEAGVKSTRRLEPFFGEIEKDSDRIVFQGQDDSWVFQMIGRIENSDEIRGRSFLARMRKTDEAINGLWKMERTGD